MVKEVKNESSCQAGSRRTGSCKIGLFSLHALLSIVYGYTLHRTYFGPAIPVSKPQGKLLGPCKYLTVWDVHFQFLISFLNLLVVITSCKRLTSVRNAVHHGLSVPYGLTVAALFWALYAIDRRLIFPKELESVIPPFVNHLLHTLVGITPLINELIMYNERKSSHFFVYFSVFVAYLAQLLIVGYYFDFWIYPVFEVLSNLGRFVFLIICIGLGILVYMTHGALHSYVWDKQIKESKKKKNYYFFFL